MKSKSGSDFLVLWKYSEAPRVNALVMVGAEGTRHCGRGVSRGRAATAMSKLPMRWRHGFNGLASAVLSAARFPGTSGV